MQKSLSRWWLIIGVASLAVSGLLALVLVGGRSPLFASPFFNTLFYKALVVHVDLSVLVWFLSIACLLWSLMVENTKFGLPLESGALISFGLGTLSLTFSAFDGDAVALMSNYIPVVTSPLFFLGLGLIFCGVLLMLVAVFSG